MWSSGERTQEGVAYVPPADSLRTQVVQFSYLKVTRSEPEGKLATRLFSYYLGSTNQNLRRQKSALGCSATTPHAQFESLGSACERSSTPGMQLGLQQDMPDVPPPWVDASDLLLQAERLTLSPPPAASSGRVRTLQELVCAFLARHLHTLALLDDLPEHLAATVRDSIRRDRSLLGDDGLGVWLDAVLETGDTRQLSLRWAQGLTDSGLGQLRSRAEWASTLVALDPSMKFSELLRVLG